MRGQGAAFVPIADRNNHGYIQMMMKLVYPILKTGLLIGLMDGVAASLNAFLASGVTPDKVFRFIASGVFGMAAFKESGAMVAWGVVFHFVIAGIWTALFFFLATYVQHVRQYSLLSGMLYGIFVWAAMEYLVLPLSNTPALSSTLAGTLVMIGIHVLVIGIPMGYAVSRYCKQIATG